MARKIKHPYASIEHRIIDSPAYADLRFSSQALLLILARQYNGSNNGHLQATYSYCRRYGMNSERTLANAVAELVQHGLIYRTRSHGANRQWAKYAVTWHPIKIREGLFLDGYKPDAWRDWQGRNKKSSPQKMQDGSSRKCSFTPQFPAENAGSDLQEIPCMY